MCDSSMRGVIGSRSDGSLVTKHDAGLDSRLKGHRLMNELDGGGDLADCKVPARVFNELMQSQLMQSPNHKAKSQRNDVEECIKLAHKLGLGVPMQSLSESSGTAVFLAQWTLESREDEHDTTFVRGGSMCEARLAKADLPEGVVLKVLKLAKRRAEKFLTTDHRFADQVRGDHNPRTLRLRGEAAVRFMKAQV